MTLNDLKISCENCEKCELSEVRTNIVFGGENNNAKIMFIGEAPGENEDLSGKPFVGRAGKMLDGLLAEVGLCREDVYIANILKCRPPKNRDPKHSETEMCIDYLFKQIELIQPNLIVCLGRISSCRLIDKKVQVTKQHGEIFEINGNKFMPTFHPAAILRNPHNRPLALKDFLTIKMFNDKNS